MGSLKYWRLRRKGPIHYKTLIYILQLRLNAIRTPLIKPISQIGTFKAKIHVELNGNQNNRSKKVIDKWQILKT